jgi:hypothetical protein
MSPTEFAELTFDRTPITQIERIFADLFEEDLACNISRRFRGFTQMFSGINSTFRKNRDFLDEF